MSDYTSAVFGVSQGEVESGLWAFCVFVSHENIRHLSNGHSLTTAT